jgi:hypothetical protein
MTNAKYLISSLSIMSESTPLTSDNLVAQGTNLARKNSEEILHEVDNREVPQ